MKETLEQLLRHLALTSPTRAFRENARRRLFSKIQKQEFWIVRLLKDIFQPAPSSEFTYMAWQRVIARIEQPAHIVRESIFTLIQRLVFSHKYISILLTTVFVCVFVITIPQTSATAKTELIVHQGTVTVKSLGEEWRNVKYQEVLKIGDQVKTGNNSRAEILFPNYSVVRMASNTHINIAQFLQDTHEENPIILKLQAGRLWSSVISEQQEVFIETKQSRISANFGIFDVLANGATTVRSIQNMVYVESRTLDLKSHLMLSAGFETTVSNVTIQPVSTTLTEDLWSQENQKKDRYLRQEIFDQEQKELKKIAGILPGNPLYDMKQVVSNALATKNLEFVQAEFAASKVLANEGINDLATEQFRQAQTDLQALWTTPENQQDILDYLVTEKVFFSQILPSNTLVQLKPLFQELFIAYAHNPEQEKLNQVSDKMLEVQNLIVQDQAETQPLLVASINSFLLQNKALINEAMNTGEKVNMEKMLAFQTQNLKVLNDIAPSINDPEAQKNADLTRKELVNAIESIVEKLAPEQTPLPRRSNQSQANWFASQIDVMVKKIEIYQSTQARLNTMYWILEKIEDRQESLGFLYALKDAMPENVKFLISKKILKIRKLGE